MSDTNKGRMSLPLPRGQMKHRQVSVSLPEELFQSIEAVRAKTGHSRSEILQHLLRMALAELEAKPPHR